MNLFDKPDEPLGSVKNPSKFAPDRRKLALMYLTIYPSTFYWMNLRRLSLLPFMSPAYTDLHDTPLSRSGLYGWGRSRAASLGVGLV